jgi:hypothetical protein
LTSRHPPEAGKPPAPSRAASGKNRVPLRRNFR